VAYGEVRSRWSYSTTATLAAAGAKTLTSPSASEKLRFRLGSVVHRVQACRAGGDVAPSKAHTRCSSEPSATPGADGQVADVGVRSELGHEAPDAESSWRRKPIPLKLFFR
jgi:hypothetical protein